MNSNRSQEGPLKHIPWNEIDFVRVGNTQDNSAQTGVTVLYFPKTALAGVDISGGGPASRETPVLSPLTNTVSLNALVLSGGSAFGLAASDGVMRTLEKHGIGCKTEFGLVPIVCQSCIYDLGYGSSSIRPNADMGAEAAENALKKSLPISGNMGGGTGASVGKFCGMKRAMKTGIGYSAVQIGEFKLGAVVVLNAVGDIFDHNTGEKIAGLLNEDRTNFISTAEYIYKNNISPDIIQSRSNTTIGAIVCNGKFNKAELTKIAEMARAGYARCINPVGTMLDGDTIYAATSGTPVEADINVVGTLAAEVMCEAIEDAVHSAQISDEEYLRNCGKTK